MKKLIFIYAVVVFISSCKKTTTSDPVVKLKSITYTNSSNSTQNKTYRIFRNSTDLIDSVVVTGLASSDYKRFSFFHTSQKIDSIVQYNSSNVIVQTAKAIWTGNLMTGFWILTYTYDSENRITQKLYSDGSFFRVEYPGDSAVFYYDLIGPDPEYKKYVQYYNKSVKNPFRLYKYDNSFPINNLIFNAISSDFTGNFSYAFGKANLYNTSGVLTTSYQINYSGNFNGYPTALEYVVGGISSYTLSFEYE